VVFISPFFQSDGQLRFTEFFLLVKAEFANPTGQLRVA